MIPKSRKDSIENYNKHKPTLDKKICSIPNCKDNSILSAHTISACLGLRKISHKNDVYCIERPDFHKIYKNGKLSIVRKNIKSASTLKMFCQKHDKSVFAPIEDATFVLSMKNCFLLAYRAVCAISFLEGDDNQFVDESKKNLNSNLKKTFDSIYENENYDALNHFIFEVENNLLLDSEVIIPYANFKNEEIQSFSYTKENNPATHSIIINSMIGPEIGYIIFSYEKNNEAFFKKFMKGLIDLQDKEQQARLLTNLFFKECKNINFNIKWWDQLSKEKRDILEGYIQFTNNWDQEEIIAVIGYWKWVITALRLHFMSSTEKRNNLMRKIATQYILKKHLEKINTFTKIEPDNDNSELPFKIKQSYFLNKTTI